MTSKLKIYERETKKPDGVRTVSFKGVGTIGKRNYGALHRKEARRRSKFRPLTDEEINSFIKCGFRVHDKRRGIYVHI